MTAITHRLMAPSELARLGEIDRTERVETIYLQRGSDLEESAQPFDIPPLVAHRHSRA